MNFRKNIIVYFGASQPQREGKEENSLNFTQNCNNGRAAACARFWAWSRKRVGDKNKITSVYFWNMRSSLIKALGARELALSLSLSHSLLLLLSLFLALSLCLSWERWHSGWPESRTSFRICCGLFAAFRQLRPSVCKRRATRTVHLDPPEDSNYIVSAWVSATDSQSHSLSRSLVLSRSLRLSCRRSSNQSTWLVSLCVCVCVCRLCVYNG